MDVADKETIPGYLYFRDNQMDYKIGLTNNLLVRGRAYKTENPRDTVVDTFSVETYAEAEAIEAEMKEAARAEGLCSFDNSSEWLKRREETKAFWNRFVHKYARKTKAEWSKYEPPHQSKYEPPHQSNVEKLAAFIKKHHGASPDLEARLAALKQNGNLTNDVEYFKALDERLKLHQSREEKHH